MNELDFIDKCVEKVKKYAEMTMAYRDENEKLKNYYMKSEQKHNDVI